jgi:hypothetical protein
MKNLKRTVATTFVLMLCALSQANAADPETEAPAKTSTPKTFMGEVDTKNSEAGNSAADANGVYWVAGCECSNDFNGSRAKSRCARVRTLTARPRHPTQRCLFELLPLYGMWLTQWAFLGTTGSCQF